MVDELLHQKNGYDAKNSQYSQVDDQKLQYIRRDDSTSESLHSASDSSINNNTTISLFGNSSASEWKQVRLHAFENIGDDDL